MNVAGSARKQAGGVSTAGKKIDVRKTGNGFLGIRNSLRPPLCTAEMSLGRLEIRGLGDPSNMAAG